MHVGQSEVAAEVVPCEDCMIDAEQVQHRGVEIVKVDFASDQAVLPDEFGPTTKIIPVPR